MAKKGKQRQPQPKRSNEQERTEAGGATLKELLGADTLQKLKAQADELKTAEADRKEKQRLQEEEAKKQEKKRLENDFSYLLENSDSKWSKYK
ncbi:YqkE family protein [Paenibacillus sp. NPDC057967]|uniref:YqkE family protein n=1 Tax=Paenibacillus sp. NPDC057967 TaxID=3346293 RepID=UPI0036DF90FB